MGFGSYSLYTSHVCALFFTADFLLKLLSFSYSNLFFHCWSLWCKMTQGQWLSKYEGKKVVAAKPSLKITVPRFDNSEIIASYGKTLIGRCMNPQKQDMKILLFMMPKIWQVEGRVAGTDLGLGRFQFDFDMEEDITEVLKMEPFHFDYWMVSLVRWKPVLEANYPSSITFWVRVLDMPLQFRAAQTLHSVGQAIGRVIGEVDVLGGRVRVEVDGFKPLIFTMAIEFEEGVEVTVSLRYEKLFGYCRECFRMTHDKTRCPSLHQEITSEEGVMEGTAVFGATATSYKAAVASTREPGGERIDGERNDGKPVHFQSSRDGNKGKGIVREKPGPYRQEGSYHAYRERLPRGNGEGSSFRGRQYGYPSRRYEGQYQGIQRSRNDAGDGRLHVDNPEKLMLDAFKGLNRSSNEGDTKQGIMVGSETASKARKALLFEESSGVDENKGSDGVAVKALRGISSSDDANLMVEGVILSDSELMVDEEFGDTQEWEEGEIELMEEEVDAEQEVAAEEQGEIDQVKGEEDFEKEKQAKKKMTKPGALAGSFDKGSAKGGGKVQVPQEGVFKAISFDSEYKGTGGERIDGERNDGKPVHFQSSRDGNKGKGIVRRSQDHTDRKAPTMHTEKGFLVVMERVIFEGGSMVSGIQRSRNDAGDGRLHVDNPEKLMLDAFKGLNRSSNEGDTKQGIMVGSETASKARKALLFEESSGVDENKGSDGVAVKALSKETVVMEGVQAQRVPEGVMTDATHLEDKEVSQALDDANLMVEGVILSDSELMVDEEFGDTQEWEEGEIELMEEEVDAEQEVAAEEQGEIDQVKGEEDFEKEKQAKKKMTKPGALALGVSTKSRLVQNLISPRKKVSTKAPAKGGGKGAGPSKKESSKP
ncbi:hypothetical protein Bca52824_006959 [Brassica carinata]|uniref:DUF4283 domain-containing protein n=1 Tax=Brassica carinata TaxID=52824 RepID=A0A8X7W654_BRACI|nr:hypothetical protein Bca52824_006959 [Brassica carinata]